MHNIRKFIKEQLEDISNPSENSGELGNDNSELGHEDRQAVQDDVIVEVKSMKEELKGRVYEMMSDITNMFVTIDNFPSDYRDHDEVSDFRQYLSNLENALERIDSI